MKHHSRAAVLRSLYAHLQDHLGRIEVLVRRLPCFSTFGRGALPALLRGEPHLHAMLACQLQRSFRERDQTALADALNLVVQLFLARPAGRATIARHWALGDELEDALLVAQTALARDILQLEQAGQPFLVNWYGRIFDRLCLDARRKRARRRASFDLQAPDLMRPCEEGCDAAVEAGEMELQLRRAVARVARRAPRKQRRLLVDAYPMLWGRRSMPHGSARRLGRRCGLSESSVRTILCRLRKDVRRELRTIPFQVSRHRAPTS
jgi:DNA-directed RNA polymerase specialized sigma24 family protein